MKIEIGLPRELTDDEASKLEIGIAKILDSFGFTEYAVELPHCYVECPLCKVGENE